MEIVKPLTVLISSVGSFLGHNILDALEPVRNRVRVIGTNLTADNDRVFRCDRVYLAPPIEGTAAFDRHLEEVVAAESPDILFPGRDHDVTALARLRERRPDLERHIPCGPAWIAEMMQDKLATWNFARDHALAFAETVSTSASSLELHAFQRRHGFPLIAKPRWGYGSNGARIVFNAAQFERAIQLPDYVLQPFLAPPANLAAMTPDLSAGVPLFFEYRDDQQYTTQTTIGPDGDYGDPCCTLHHMVMGRPERTQLWSHPRMLEMSQAWTDALVRAGWRGSVNLQCRRLADDSFIGFEINGRMSGSSSARCLLGYHEPRILVTRFLGPDRWPGGEDTPRGPGFVGRLPTDGYVADRDVRTLTADRVWIAPRRRAA